MGRPKWLGGNPITDDDPLQVTDATASAVLGTTADTASSNTILGRLINLLSRLPSALGQAAGSASMPVVLNSDADWIKAEDAAAASGDKGVPLLAVRNDTAAALAGTTLDYINLTTDGIGRLWVNPGYSGAFSDSGPTPVGVLDVAGNGRPLATTPMLWNGANSDRQRVPSAFKPISLSAATTETTIWTPTTAKKFRLIRLILTAGAQTVLTFKDNTAGTTILIVELGANVPFTVELGPNGILSAAANNVLTVTRGTSATLNGTIVGTEE